MITKPHFTSLAIFHLWRLAAMWHMTSSIWLPVNNQFLQNNYRFCLKQFLAYLYLVSYNKLFCDQYLSYSDTQHCNINSFIVKETYPKQVPKIAESRKEVDHESSVSVQTILLQSGTLTVELRHGVSPVESLTDRTHVSHSHLNVWNVQT